MTEEPQKSPARIAMVAVGVGVPTKCLSPEGLAIHEGDQCILDNEGVLECGPIVKLHEIGPRDDAPRLPRLVRRATLQDLSREKETALLSKMAIGACAEAIRKLGLPMRLVDVRYSFDRRVLGILFSAEDRVDFRDLIKELAGQLETRVRMKQIGVRDEAGIIGGLGPCGRMLCCCSWLRRFESINVRMAKTQRISMNPTAIGGMCGRLKCCLRYETDQYQDMDRHLPRDGERVKCPDGIGVVIDKDILRQRVRVKLEDLRVVECAAADIAGMGGDGVA